MVIKLLPMIQLPLGLIICPEADQLRVQLRNKFLLFLQDEYGDEIKTEMSSKLLFLDLMYLRSGSKLEGIHDKIISYCENLFSSKGRDVPKPEEVISQVLTAPPKHEYLRDLLIRCQEDKLNEDEDKLANMATSICKMFYLELGDWFYLYISKHLKKLNSWLSKHANNLSIEALKIFQTHDKELQSTDINIDEEDLNIKHVIDADYRFIDHLTNTMTDDFYLNYCKMPHVMAWNSDKDYSKHGDLALRNSKIIGYIDYSFDKVVNATHYDNHLGYAFKSVEWHEYTPIQSNSSIRKYPSALMTGIFNFGPLFSPRGVQFVFSSRSKKGTNDWYDYPIHETSFLFKSTDFVKGASNKDMIKCPFLGGRTYNMVDKNRTRYSEVRTCNLGGFLNLKMVFTNPLSAKKLCMDNYNGILKAIREVEHSNYAIPDPEQNHLSKILHNYISHYYPSK